MMRILIAACDEPAGARALWSSGQFPLGLCKALQEQGVSCEMTPDPDAVDAHAADAVLVLTDGDTPVTAVKAYGVFRVLWILGPCGEAIERQLDSYDLVLTAAELDLPRLRRNTRAPVALLREGIDSCLLTPACVGDEIALGGRAGLLYVADSPGERRTTARWLAKSGESARIFGRGWACCGLAHAVEAERPENPLLLQRVRECRFGLVDHTRAQRCAGYIDPMLLVFMAHAVPVITEDLPVTRRLAGDAALYATGVEGFQACLRHGNEHYGEQVEVTRARWYKIKQDYSLARRAKQLLEWIERPPAPESAALSEPANETDEFYSDTVAAGALLDAEAAAFAERRLAETERALAKARARITGDDQGRKYWIERAGVAALYARDLEKYIAELYETASWRVTSPLRAFGRLARMIHRGRRVRPPGPPEAPPDFDALLDCSPARESMAGGAVGSRRFGLVRVLRALLPEPYKRGILIIMNRLGLPQPTRLFRRPVPTAPETPRTAGPSATVSDDAGAMRYWRLQARQLLEELEYTRGSGDSQEPSGPQPPRV